MSNPLEILDSAKEVAAPTAQLSQECWNFDKNQNSKPLNGNNDSVVDFGKTDIYKTVSGQEITVVNGTDKDFKVPAGYDIDPGFVPHGKDLVTSNGDRGTLLPGAPDGSLLPGAPDGTLLPAAPDSTIKTTAPDGTLLPGAPDGTLKPGAPDGSLLPGAPDGSLLPGAPDGSLLPGAPDGSLLPGAPDGSLLPGAPDGTLKPSAK
jgi:hypothetical protein